MPGTMNLHRVLTAKPEKVYRAFVEPDAVESWLPHFGYTCTVHKLEASEGGTHRMSFRNFTTGDSHSFGGTYLKLVPNKTLIYADSFDNPNLPGVMTVTVTLILTKGRGEKTNAMACDTQLKREMTMTRPEWTFLQEKQLPCSDRPPHGIKKGRPAT